MMTGNLKGAIALGGLTATVALLASLSGASAQSAPGAGSFPQSFLVPGTNTSLSIYGVIKSAWKDQWGSQHTSDAGAPPGAQSAPFAIGALALQGPGVSSPCSSPATGSPAGVVGCFNALHGGLSAYSGISTMTFETRTPSSLGEIKTVLSMDFNLLANQANYSEGGIVGIKPSAGSGNTRAPRMLFAYGTIGPWLIGQYNSAYADATLYPDITDPGFGPGAVQTANVRQPQLRYTYLAGNGITLSASVEYQESGTLYLGGPGNTQGPAAMTSASVNSVTSDNTDIGGVVNLPSFNTGVAWDQPWGHIMSRVGVSRNEIRNTELPGVLGAPAPAAIQMGSNIKKWGWAIEGGGYLNTWGQDQWKFLINYSDGVGNYLSDLSAGAPNSGNMFCNTYTGSCNLIAELGASTSYTHRFSPNWRSTAAFGMGFFSKPSAAGGLINCSGTGAGCSGGTTAAQLASLEKRHLASQLNVVYSPVPGLTDIYLEWDHYNRWVQATNTSGVNNTYSVTFNIFW
jgi:hypothetical protein